jgi:hypothetical protein
MSATPRILEAQSEWTSTDVADEELWTERFDDNEQAELEAALRHALAKSDDVLELGCDDFPLPTLHGRLLRIENELINGRGFVRLRGVDRRDYTQAEMEIIYWGIGTHLGLPWAQNKYGHVLGDVTDQHKGIDDPTARGNELGGIALRIHNRLVSERPDLAAALYDDLPNDFRGEQAAGGKPYYLVPVFTEWDDRLFVRCIPPYILASQRHPETPRLTDLQKEALAAVVEMADDPENHVLMDLLPGDMQFINNYHVFHGRTAYEDDRTSGHIRHLKRLWLETTVLESRPPYFANNRTHWSEHRTASRLQVH